MKTPNYSKPGPLPRWGILAAAALTAWSAFQLRATDIFWTGGTASYTNSANWLGSLIPGAADSAINDTTTNDAVQINVGNPDWTVFQLRAGNGTGSGAFVQNGQTLSLSSTPKALRLGVATGRTGVYTLNNGTINYGGGEVNVGQLGRGIMNVNGGTINGSGVLAVSVGSSLDGLTATMGGTNKSDYAWFEQGFYTPDSARGIPPAGSTFTNETLTDHSYKMPANYAGNDAVLVFAGQTTATITFSSPTAATALSLLGSAGFGTSTLTYKVHHADSSVENGTVNVLDWFDNGGTVAWRSGGRSSANGLDIQIINDGPRFPYLLSFDLALTNTTSAVTSVDFTYVSGGVACLLAASSSTGAEFTPATITGYNADMILESGAPIYASKSVTNVLNQAAGIINITGEFWVGNFGSGLFNFNGGTNTFQNWLALGRAGGVGTINMTAGELDKIGNGNFLIGTGYQAPNGSTPTGILNQSGGIINSAGEFSIPENSPANGFYNLSGTGVLNVNNWMQVGRSGGTGFMTISGGTVTKNGGGNFIVGDNATGTLTQTGGSIAVESGESWIGQGGSANGTYNLGAGTFACNNNWISIGRNGGTGALNLTNGVFTKAGGGNFSIGGDGGANGTLTQYGGAVNNFANSGSYTWLGQGGGHGSWFMFGGSAHLGILQFCEGGNGSGYLELDGGTLSAFEVNAGSDVADSTLVFNGGTLQATGDNANFLHGLASAYIQVNGAAIDSQGFKITVPQSLGDNGGGGLTKLGAGTLVLSGANTYVGPTLVNAGTLVIRSDTTAAGAYSVASGAQLSLTVLGLNAQLNISSLTLAAATPALGFDLGAFGNPTTSAPLNVAGNLAVSGTVAVNIADALPQAGQFPLIKYGTKTGAGSFVLGTLPVGVAATLSNNIANNSLDLVISSVNLPRWEGLAGGNWDIGLTTNWVNIGDGLPTFYGQGNAVLFDDNAQGTTTVNLTTTVNPSSVTINNTNLTYTVNGSGKISGSTGLLKQGAGSATLANTGGNNYTGPTTISGGTLSVASLANGGSPSAIGSASASPTNLVLSGGTLRYSGPNTTINRAYSLLGGGGGIETVNNLTLSSLPTAAPGAGFTKTGAGQLAYVGVGSNTLAAASYGIREGSVVLDGSAGGQTNVVTGAFSVAGAANAVAILTNTTLTVNDNGVGNVANTVGSMTMNNGSTLNVNSWFTLGDAANSVNTFSLNGGAINVNNGRLFLCSAPGTMSTMNINGGQINKSGDVFVIVDGNWNGNGARTGVVNQVAGTIECSSEFWLGQTSPGQGIYNLSNGVINLHNWLAIGRSGGSGLINLTGGTFNKDGNGNFIIGTGGGSFGTLNHSAGTINCANEYWLAESGGCEGTNNISGTAVVNIGSWVSIGRGGHGVINFSGGTINKTGGGNFIVGDNGNGYFNQTGGTLTDNNDIWIGQAGGGVGQYDLSAGTVTNNAWLAIGREGAKGVLNISGGSMTKQGGGNISIAHGGGATGTINQTGGSFTCASGETWIGEDSGPGIWNISGGTATFGLVYLARNASATGTLNVNGGTVAATEITSGSSGTTTANLNGGTLLARANNANFLHGLTVANVLAGGVTIDTGTNAVSIGQSLLDGTGGGGLTKIGTGTLSLNGVNTYTGPTLINAGTLGGAGSVAGAVTIGASGAFAPGNSIGTFTVSNSLTLNGTTTMEISKNGGTTSSDLAAVTGNLAFGGELKVVLTGTNALAVNDTFNLFDWATRSGSFTGTNLPAGYAWDTSKLAVDGTIRVSAVLAPLTISPLKYSGGNLITTGSGGTAGTGYTWLSSTNAAAPIATWTTNVVGTFDSSGAFSNNLPVNASEPQRYYILRVP